MSFSIAKDQDELGQGEENEVSSFLILQKTSLELGFFPCLALLPKPFGLPSPAQPLCFRETLYPCVSFHSLLPSTAAWIFLLEIHKFKRGDDTGWLGDRHQIPLPGHIAFAMLMHLYLERSLHPLGSNQGRQGFPQSCCCCAAKGWDVVGHCQAGDRSSDACCGLCPRQQGPILPSVPISAGSFLPLLC